MKPTPTVAQKKIRVVLWLSIPPPVKKVSASISGRGGDFFWPKKPLCPPCESVLSISYERCAI